MVRLTLTNTTANRELEGNVGKFFALAGLNSQYNRFIDPFCGAGSFSLFAMQAKLARCYRLNDAFGPIIDLFRVIKQDPQALILAYKDLCEKEENSLKNLSTEKFFYESLTAELMKKKTNLLKIAAIWLFLSNRLAANRPLFVGKQLVSPFSAKQTIALHMLERQVNALHGLFKQVEITMQSKNAIDFLRQIEDLNANDLVVLDPPYPGGNSLAKSTIFFRPKSDTVLFENLLSVLKELNCKKARYIFNYDLFCGKDNAFTKGHFVDVNTYGLTHLILVSHNPYDEQFSTLFEHIYVPQYMEIDKNRLPKGFYPYADFKSLSYQEAKNLVAHI